MKVYDYEIEGSRHCREGVATEERPGVFLDTFWEGGDRHHLTELERASMRDRFDTDDFDELDQYSHESVARWETFAPQDRQTIPSQHGYHRRYFVRRGASPDLATQIENAERKVAAAERELESAARHLQWAQADLAALEGQKGRAS